LYQAETTGMPEEDKLKYDMERLRQQNEALYQQVQTYEMAQAAEANRQAKIAMYRRWGVPDEILMMPEAQYSPENMEMAANLYWQQKLAAVQSRPPAAPVAPPAQQPAPPAAPPITTHSSAAQPTDKEQKLEELKRRTEKDHESTLVEAYKVMFEED